MNSEKGTLTGDYVNVRSGPGTEYGVVRSTREGDRVTVLHKVTISGMDWYCLADGWIAAKYVQLDKDKPAETEPTTPATEPTETTAATEPAATDPVTTDPPATDPVTTDPTNPTP
jgi:N-acetylmuramoyl-L-alanine amidase